MEPDYQKYPDPLTNQDGDPRIYQEQYERWHEWVRYQEEVSSNE